MLNFILNICIIILFFCIIYKFLNNISENNKISQQNIILNNISNDINNKTSIIKDNFIENREEFDYIPESVNYKSDPIRIDLADLTNIKTKSQKILKGKDYTSDNKYDNKLKRVKYKNKKKVFSYPNNRSKNYKNKIPGINKNEFKYNDKLVDIKAIEISGLNNNIVNGDNNQKPIKFNKKTIDPVNTNKIIEDRMRNGTFIVPNYNNYFLDPIKSIDEEKALQKNINSKKLKDISNNKIDSYKYKEIGNYINFDLK